MRIHLAALCCVAALVAGCNIGNPIPAREYSEFASRSGGSYVPDHNNGEVSVWFSPKRYGYEIQGLSIKNVTGPRESEIGVTGPSSAKGEQWIILSVHNINAAKTDWHIAWDVYQGNTSKQTIHVTISPPPDVKLTIDGDEVILTK